jgi:hypothetical protein
MTTAEKIAAGEALQEQAAILQSDGGLPRRTAILKALELCFPGDFRDMMKTAGHYKDGETAIYDFIEELMGEEKQAKKDAIAGHSEAQTREGVQTHNQALESPSKGREITSGVKRTGYELMKEQVNQRLKGIA